MNAVLGFLLMAFLPLCRVATAADGQSGDRARQARSLFEAGSWHELLLSCASQPGDPADLNYFRGIALARLGRWPEARDELAAGRLKSPYDKRFPLELAGVAFRLNRRAEALSFVRAALRLDAGDRYANDFAGTLLLLQRNTRAALKFWNRIGKPQVEDIQNAPDPALDPVLLDRAFSLRPGAFVSLHHYDATLLRLRMLEVFQTADLDLVARPDERFDILFRNSEYPNLGMHPFPALIRLLSGIPYATAYPELFNVNHRALNLRSVARWDSRKRRLAVFAAAPVGGNPGRRLRFDFDGRNEEWDVAKSVGAGYSGSHRFSMKRIGAGVTLETAVGTWVVETGGSVIRRDFRSLDRHTPLAIQRDGLSLEYTLAVRKALYTAPERGLELEGDVTLNTGRLFGVGRFGGISTGIYPRWQPNAAGAGFTISGRIRAGALAGNTPFDELFSFGLERDNDLYLRGHAGTADGRKGRGPLGTRYFLAGCELDKILARAGLVRLSAGPFLDTGRMYDPHGVFGSRGWLYDAGIQIRLSVLNTVTVSLSFGKDLRSGGQAFFVNTSSGRK